MFLHDCNICVCFSDSVPHRDAGNHKFPHLMVRLKLTTVCQYFSHVTNPLPHSQLHANSMQSDLMAGLKPVNSSSSALRVVAHERYVAQNHCYAIACNRQHAIATASLRHWFPLMC